MQNGKAMLADMTQGDTSAEPTLKAIVRKALISILNDESASAAAKASAGRTLMQYFADESAPSARRGADMTAAELDQAISLARR